MPGLGIEVHPQYQSSCSAGLGQRLGWGTQVALLVVDVCAAYWKQGSPLDLSHNAESAASPGSMRRLVQAARAGGVPVVWAHVRYNHPQMKDGGIQAKKTKTILAWQDGDPRGLDTLLPGLEPREYATVVLKRNPSAFFGSTLATELHLLGVDTLAICGVSTSGCVRATAMGAMCYGFRPMVVREACGDRSLLIQEQSLFDIDATIEDVVTEEEAIEKLRAGASEQRSRPKD